jgi:hypothetical protein
MLNLCCCVERRATLAFPSLVLGPVDLAQGFQPRISSLCRCRCSGVHALPIQNSFDCKLFDFHGRSVAVAGAVACPTVDGLTMAINGRRPVARSTRMSPSCSSRRSPASVASRETCNRSKTFPVSLNGFTLTTPSSHQSAKARCKDFPGNAAALSNHFIGIGPRRNSSLMGESTNPPDTRSNRTRFVGMLLSLVYIIDS